MSGAYDELLDATIQHLEGLKSRGVRQVAVSPETLRALAQPAKFQISNLKAQTHPPAPVATTKGTPETQIIATASAGATTPHVVARNLPVAAGISADSAPAPAAFPSNPAPVPRPQTPDHAPQAMPRLDPVAKAAAFADLRARALACVKCPRLASSRKTVVFGVGNPEARLMFVGEAPGAEEDEQGEPFVGRAGELLTKIIQATGLQRGDVYIANILKCRPDTPGQASGNRKPTPEEMATCIPYLHEQIDLISPKVLVALGATAVDGLLGKTIGITKLRGSWRTYRGIPLMPTYHPAYLLRTQAMTDKRKVWEDMLAVMEKLEMPISAKQRNYFQKS